VSLIQRDHNGPILEKQKLRHSMVSVTGLGRFRVEPRAWAFQAIVTLSQSLARILMVLRSKGRSESNIIFTTRVTLHLPFQLQPSQRERRW
jgi:hypothetical protein